MNEKPQFLLYPREAMGLRYQRTWRGILGSFTEHPLFLPRDRDSARVYSHVQKNWWRPFIRVSAKISRGKKLIGALEVSYTASSSFRFLLNKRRISLKCVYFEELINGMHAVAKTLLNEKLLLIQHLWLSGFWIPASSSNM